MKARPNLLLILTDQQNGTMMSCAGNVWLHTPAMDRLASEGVRFERTTCTNPVCVASRFSLLTGRRPSRIGLFSNATDHIAAIPDEIRLNGLGWLMQQAGYRTAYAGKVHAPKMSAEDLGFESLDCKGRDDVVEACRGFLRRTGSEPFILVASFVNPHDICYMAIRDSAHDDAERRTVCRGVDACRRLDQALARPPGLDDAAFFETACPPLPPNVDPPDDEPEAIKALLARRPFRKHAREAWSDRRWREHRWAYARLTESVDASIGALLNAVRDANVWDNTVIAFTSDHGDMDGAFRMEHKSTLYNEACRVPFVIRDPETPVAGMVEREHLVCNGLDLLPTLCDYAGVPVPDTCSGRSLRPFVNGARPDGWREAVPIECVIGRAVCTTRLKYTRYDFGHNREQLFDLEADPYETTNVVRNPLYAEKADEMRQMFERLHGDRPGGIERIHAEMLNA